MLDISQEVAKVFEEIPTEGPVKIEFNNDDVPHYVEWFLKETEASRNHPLELS